MNRPLTERRPDEPGPSGPAGSPHWPRVPEPPEAMLRALLLQWDRTQWLPPEDLRTHQLKQAARLLGHALQSVPYQQERLARAGLALDQELTWPLWRRIPVVTRARLKAAGNSIRATRLPTDHGAPAGAGPIQQTAVTRLFRNAVALRDHRWQRRDLSATLAAIVADHSGSAAFPEGRRAASWGPFADQGFPTGPAMFLAADTPIDLQLLWLRQVTPRYLAADRRTIEALARRTLERPGDGGVGGRTHSDFAGDSVIHPRVVPPSLGRAGERHVRVAGSGHRRSGLSRPPPFPGPVGNRAVRGARRRWCALPVGAERTAGGHRAPQLRHACAAPGYRPSGPMGRPLPDRPRAVRFCALGRAKVGRDRSLRRKRRIG